MYINDLPNCLKHCTARLYADDTSLNTSGSHIKVIEPLMNADLKHVSSWLIANKLTLNMIKTVYMVVGSRQRLATLEGDINLQINSTSLNRVQDTKCLGVQIDENLTWERHAEYIIQKVACNITILRKVSPIFCHWIIELLYIDLLLNPILAIAALSEMASMKHCQISSKDYKIGQPVF